MSCSAADRGGKPQYEQTLAGRKDFLSSWESSGDSLTFLWRRLYDSVVLYSLEGGQIPISGLGGKLRCASMIGNISQGWQVVSNCTALPAWGLDEGTKSPIAVWQSTAQTLLAGIDFGTRPAQRPTTFPVQL